MKLADTIHIDTPNGNLIIDDHPLGVYLADAPVIISLGNKNELGSITLTILAKQITIEPKAESTAENDAD